MLDTLPIPVSDEEEDETNNVGPSSSVAATSIRVSDEEEDENNNVGPSSSVTATSIRVTSGGKYYVHMQTEREEVSVSPDYGKGPADVDQVGAGGTPWSSQVVRNPKRDLVIAHGKGKGGAKRHRKVVKPVIEGMSNNEIKRLARRAGVQSICGKVYEEVRMMIQNFLDDVLFKTLVHVEHKEAKTVTPHDVVHGFKSLGGSAYGFGI